MALRSERAGFGHQIFELGLHPLRFLNGRFLIAFHLAETAPFGNQLQRLEPEINCQRRQRDDQRHVRPRAFDGEILLHFLAVFDRIFVFFNHGASLLLRGRILPGTVQIDAAVRQQLFELRVIGLHRHAGKHGHKLAVKRFDLNGLGDLLLPLAHLSLDRLVTKRNYNIQEHENQNQHRPSGHKNICPFVIQVIQAFALKNSGLRAFHLTQRLWILNG